MKRMSFKKVLESVLLVVLLITLVVVNKNYAKAAVNGSLTALTTKTGDEKFTDVNSCDGILVTEDTDSNKSATVSVTTECSGLLTLYFLGQNTDNVYLRVYSDEACTDEIGYDSIGADTSAQGVASDAVEIPSAGIYYVKLTSYEKNDIQFSIAADICSADDDALEAGQSVYISELGYDDENYYKIESNKSGIIDVFISYADTTSCYGDISLCKKVNGKMKVLATGDVKEDGSGFALSKGTYYIKFSGATSAFYAIHYKFSAITDKSGSTKAKAKAIPYGKIAKGLIFTTEKASKADWYKFVNTKSREITIYFEGEVTGGVTLEFYGPDGDKFGSLYISAYTTSNSGSPYVGSYSSDSGKLPKGTYYIKVTKDNSQISGAYSIKLK